MVDEIRSLKVVEVLHHYCVKAADIEVDENENIS